MMAYMFPTWIRILFRIALYCWEGEWNLVHYINQVVQKYLCFFFQILTFILTCPQWYVFYLKEWEEKSFLWCSRLNHSEDKTHYEDVERNLHEITTMAGEGKEFLSLPIVLGKDQTKDIESFWENRILNLLIFWLFEKPKLLPNLRKDI